MAEFDPDQIVISTLPTATSVWLRNDVVDGARRAYPDIPVTTSNRRCRARFRRVLKNSARSERRPGGAQ